MKKLIRFGVSLDHHLLDDFDLHIKKRKYTNRSEALRSIHLWLTRQVDEDLLKDVITLARD